MARPTKPKEKPKATEATIATKEEKTEALRGVFASSNE